jgi:GDP-L-fucose synthase
MSVYVAGHTGMVGSSIVRRLGKDNVITRTSSELDLRNQAEVNAFFAENRPEYVYLCAAKVGGINANNKYRAEFIYDNLIIHTNVIHAAYLNGVKRLIFLGSSCVYPKFAPQPIKEEYLLTGELEPTNEPYAIAKIAGLKMCEAYRHQYGCDFFTVMPPNLFGIGDNYHPHDSHVIASMMRKFHHAKENGTDVELWGDGTPLREVMCVDALAASIVELMENGTEHNYMNIGSGQEFSVSELAEIIATVIGFNGRVVWNAEYPNGTPRKLMDSSRHGSVDFDMVESLRKAYNDYLSRHA